MGTWQRSETYFKLALIPKETKLGSLDLRDEIKFVQLIHQHYVPSLHNGWSKTGRA